MEVPEKNYYRRIILSDEPMYLDNGFICEKTELEQWEANIPCDRCWSLECGPKACICYKEWLEKRPLKRITKEIREKL
jgi:hypothetical protein